MSNANAKNLSIHPRNWPRSSQWWDDETKKRDTSKPQKGRARKLDRKRARLNARRNDREMTVRTPSIRPEAFRVPGSMND